MFLDDNCAKAAVLHNYSPCTCLLQSLRVICRVGSHASATNRAVFVFESPKMSVSTTVSELFVVGRAEVFPFGDGWPGVVLDSGHSFHLRVEFEAHAVHLFLPGAGSVGQQGFAYGQGHQGVGGFAEQFVQAFALAVSDYEGDDGHVVFVGHRESAFKEGRMGL